MKYTTEIFIKKAKPKYGNRYGYDKVEFIKSILPVTIFCNKCKKYCAVNKFCDCYTEEVNGNY